MINYLSRDMAAALPLYTGGGSISYAQKAGGYMDGKSKGIRIKLKMLDIFWKEEARKSTSILVKRNYQSYFCQDENPCKECDLH